jgi:hypothetical protein
MVFLKLTGQAWFTVQLPPLVLDELLLLALVTVGVPLGVCPASAKVTGSSVAQEGVARARPASSGTASAEAASFCRALTPARSSFLSFPT